MSIDLNEIYYYWQVVKFAERMLKKERDLVDIGRLQVDNEQPNSTR
jgi:hypothetical protein